MGNENSMYTSVDPEVKIPGLPKPNSFHRKGKPYGLMVDRKLNSKNMTVWAYWNVYDLRNGQSTWRLSDYLYGGELQFKFQLVQNKDDKICFTFPLRYSSRSNTYMTVLKGQEQGKYVELEIYADNIHCRIMENLEVNASLKCFGFVKFDNQDKIPIAF